MAQKIPCPQCGKKLALVGSAIHCPRCGAVIESAEHTPAISVGDTSQPISGGTHPKPAKTMIGKMKQAIQFSQYIQSVQNRMSSGEQVSTEEVKKYIINNFDPLLFGRFRDDAQVEQLIKTISGGQTTAYSRGFGDGNAGATESGIDIQTTFQTPTQNNPQYRQPLEATRKRGVHFSVIVVLVIILMTVGGIVYSIFMAR